jgi:hypothetical protein
MTPAERVATLQRAVEALRAIEAQRRQALPPPSRPDLVRLRELREFVGLADRLDSILAFEGFDQHAVWARDVGLSMDCHQYDISLLHALSIDRGAGTPYREDAPSPEHAAALLALAALLSRYEAGEFMPPNSYFGLPEPQP